MSNPITENTAKLAAAKVAADRYDAATKRISEYTGIPMPEIYVAFQGLRDYLSLCHTIARKGGWWNDPETGEQKVRNRGEMLMLIVSEVAEAMEGERKNLNDDKIPHRKMAEVELADVLIRVGDYAGGLGYDVGLAALEKMAFNIDRADHKPENRAAAGGKAF